MNRRTRPIAALSAFLVLASACGSADTEPAAQPAAAEAPDVGAGDNSADATGGTEASGAEGTDPAPTAAPAGDADSTNDNSSSGSDTDPAATDAEADDTNEPGPAESVSGDDAAAATPAAATWPNDGCSTDGSATATDAAEGPAPALEIRAESADSLLPSVPVRRVNCNGGWVNFQNELPSPQPLLVWFWAPH